MTQEDEFGNKIIATAQPPFGTIIVTLILLIGGKQLIGTINPAKRILFVTWNKKKHFFRALQSYGFNWNLINNEIFPFDNVIMTIGKNKYYFSRQFVKDNCIIHYHLQSGLELQVFLPKKLILEHKME